MNGLFMVIISALVLVLAYRFYGAFISAKVLVVNQYKVTPAFRFEDGHAGLLPQPAAARRCQGGSASMGRTLYKRHKRFRHDIFFRLQSALLLLPECCHQPCPDRQTNNGRTPAPDLRRIDSPRSTQHQPRHADPLYGIHLRKPGRTAARTGRVQLRWL